MIDPSIIRLVIWDLDETFWGGSLAETAAVIYSTENDLIVRRLVDRGIMNSICSKNDFTTAREVLERKGIWESFIFPSISWAPKGPRLASIVRAIGFRSESVLFLDDDAANRGAALNYVPGIIAMTRLQADDVLKAAATKRPQNFDCERIRHYKSLERRLVDRQSDAASDEAFLRDCQIRVYFDYNVEKSIDRAIELVNRTNRLNFTKVRLSDDNLQAKAQLLSEINVFSRQSALVKVVDRYGDHGFCGFFLRTNGKGSGPGTLLHFCFSCRLLGMHVERWVYEKIGRPNLTIAQPVFTNLHEERVVDWIGVGSADFVARQVEAEIPAIRLRGGCEMDALAHYLEPYSKRVDREASLARRPFFVAKDCSHHIVLDGEEELEPDFVDFAQKCGFRTDDFKSNVFSQCQPGTLIVISTWGDVNAAYRHSSTGRVLTIDLPGFNGDVTELEDRDINFMLTYKIERQLDDREREQCRTCIATLASSGTFIGPPSETEVSKNLRRIFAAIPQSATAAILAADPYRKEVGKVARIDSRLVNFNAVLEAVATEFKVQVFYTEHYILDNAERLFTGHFHRIVYARLAGDIVRWAFCKTALT